MARLTPDQRSRVLDAPHRQGPGRAGAGACRDRPAGGRAGAAAALPALRGDPASSTWPASWSTIRSQSWRCKSSATSTGCSRHTVSRPGSTLTWAPCATSTITPGLLLEVFSPGARRAAGCRRPLGDGLLERFGRRRPPPDWWCSRLCPGSPRRHSTPRLGPRPGGLLAATLRPLGWWAAEVRRGGGGRVVLELEPTDEPALLLGAPPTLAFPVEPCFARQAGKCGCWRGASVGPSRHRG